LSFAVKLKEFEAEEDRAFEPINFGDCIDGLVPNQFALEAQFELTASFRAAHQLANLEDGSAVGDGYTSCSKACDRTSSKSVPRAGKPAGS
jgi:hypothetical protein